MGKAVLIDGHSILSRAFYGVPELTNSEGLHTNAVYGFLNIMFKVIDEEAAEYLAVAFDLKEPTLRHKIYEEYKGTRKPMPPELHEQVPIIQDVLKAMKVPILTMAGYEADDILGTIAKRLQAEGEEVTILSGDRDLLQLSDIHIKLAIPRTSKGSTELHYYYPEDVKREYGVTPHEYIDVKALMGDTSDNIPGVPSIGEKTAVSLVSTYGSIEDIEARLSEVKPPRAQKALAEHYDLAVLSKDLATIRTDCPIDFDLEDARIGDIYTPEAYDCLNRLEFKSLLSRFDQDSRKALSVEDNFWQIKDVSAADSIFEDAEDAQRCAFSLIFDNDDIAGLTLCFGEDRIYLIPAEDGIKGEYLLEKVKKLISSCVEKKAPIAVPDLKSQLAFIDLAGTEPVYDMGVAGYLLNPLKDTYEYDDIARDYLSMAVPSRKDLLGKKSLYDAVKEQDEKAITCACYMSYVSWKAYPILTGELKQEGMEDLYLNIEMPLIYTLYGMQKAGMRVDAKRLKDYGDHLKKEIKRMESEIYELAGETFNINSPRQLGEVLFEHMKLPHGKKTRTGYSTAADVLEKLAVDYPVVRKILDYRQYTKLNSTYADGLASYIAKDGRIHSTFNQTITATGRISSTEPNLQNIPVRMELGREIRRVFVPADGFVFIDADYSQIELRIMAHMSRDPMLIEAYNQAQDIHAITASRVFGIPLDEVTPEQRRNAKAVNFGIIYGISAFGLSEDLSISRQEANEFIDQYFRTFPGVKEYLDAQVEKAKKDGYVTTLYGRRRPIPELKSNNFAQRSFGERAAMNSPIQGSAADIMKIAMISVDDELKKRGLRSRLVLQVHDELMIEAAEDEVSEVEEILDDKMRHAADLLVPLEVSLSTGKSWYDAK